MYYTIVRVTAEEMPIHVKHFNDNTNTIIISMKNIAYIEQ